MAGDNLANLVSLSKRFASGEALLSRGGKVTEIGSSHFRASGLQDYASINERVVFETGKTSRFGKIVQITGDEVSVVPYCDTSHIKIGDHVFLYDRSIVHPNQEWLGRVVNPLGIPIDGKGDLTSLKLEPEANEVLASHIPALSRERLVSGLKTGVRAIDIFTPVCYGQRVGIFAGSGVGKSTLLGMLADADAFDCVVVALIGERGREVREFLEDCIGRALGRTVCIVATSDDSAMMRMAAPDLALQTAEYFRDNGKRVLLLLDSITRYAHAIREVAAASGELPVSRGYPPSVFAELPKILERAGTGLAGSGSITAFITVLVDGDDHNDPVADAARGILDGHIVLDREIADQGRYPPLNLLSSLSRLAPRVWSAEQQKLVHQMKALIARFEETRDLRLIGSHRIGDDELLDRAIVTVPAIYAALTQNPNAPRSKDAFADLLEHLKRATNESQNANA